MYKIMNFIKLLTVVISVSFLTSDGLEAYSKKRDVVKKVDGLDLPITICIPKEGQGPFPVAFWVHGGGWSGGTSTRLSGASEGPQAKQLTDTLGVIHVGLTYRCMQQNGTFDKALQDITDSYQWFAERASKYKADMTRVSIGGGSAGSPLAAILSQRVPCKFFIGCNGFYDMLNRGEHPGRWPSAKTQEAFQVNTPETKRAASVVYHLSDRSPAALLLHGDIDPTIEYWQSEHYAKTLTDIGIEGKALIFPQTDHAFCYPHHPDVYKSSVMAMADFSIRYFDLKGINVAELEQLVDEQLKGYQDVETIQEKDLLGTWEYKKRKQSILFQKDGLGVVTENKKEFPLTYRIENGVVVLETKNKRLSNKKIYLFQHSREIYHRDKGDIGRKTRFRKVK
jgi:acetyl esterase/lipase